MLTPWVRPAMRCAAAWILILNQKQHWKTFNNSLCKERAVPVSERPLLLVLFLACFLAAALAGERFFYALSLARLQVKRVTFHFLNNVLCLYLSLEPSQSIFEGFTLLKSNFCQRTTPPHSSYLDLLVMASLTHLSQADCAGTPTPPQKFNRIDNCNCRGANELVGFMKLVGC
jgi:hypothetical protein